MKIKLAPLFAMASIALFATQARADSLVEGSAENGEARSLPCTACHGPAGNSSNALWPNIAGQNAPYILSQLKAFKDGSRQDPLMSGQAMMLSDEDMADLAVYYESQHAAAQSVKDPASVNRGEALYRGGDSDAGVAASPVQDGCVARFKRTPEITEVYEVRVEGVEQSFGLLKAQPVDIGIAPASKIEHRPAGYGMRANRGMQCAFAREGIVVGDQPLAHISA